MERGPRARLERPGERDARWDHRAPRPLPEDERPMLPPQSLPYQ
jgi:hypothetical protein